jgi:hypothetical protein
MPTQPSAEMNPDALVWYLVNRPDGYAGMVHDWIVSDDGTPTAMIVSQGWFGRRRYEVPVSDLIAIHHASKQIFVSAAAPLPAAEGWVERILKRLGGAESERLRLSHDISEATHALTRLERNLEGFNVNLVRKARALREGAEQLAAEITRSYARR